MTTYPGDFNGHRKYFNPQRQTANRSATYLKHIAPLAEFPVLNGSAKRLYRLSPKIIYSAMVLAARHGRNGLALHMS